VLQILLLTLVEQPHTQRLYTDQVRHELAHAKQLKTKLAKARAQAKDLAERIKDRAERIKDQVQDRVRAVSPTGKGKGRREDE
jgi:hypothetical protein